MKKNNAQQGVFVFLSAIAVVFVPYALAGCDADSVGLSNEDMTLDLSDPDVVATLFAASEDNDFWAEDPEEPELVAYSADKKDTVWCLPLDCDVDGDGFAWECDKYTYEADGVTVDHVGNVPECPLCESSCTNCVAKKIVCEEGDICMCPGAIDPELAIQFTEKRRCDHRSYTYDGTRYWVGYTLKSQKLPMS